MEEAHEKARQYHRKKADRLCFFAVLISGMAISTNAYVFYRLPGTSWIAAIASVIAFLVIYAWANEREYTNEGMGLPFISSLVWLFNGAAVLWLM